MPAQRNADVDLVVRLAASEAVELWEYAELLAELRGAGYPVTEHLVSGTAAGILAGELAVRLPRVRRERDKQKATERRDGAERAREGR